MKLLILSVVLSCALAIPFSSNRLRRDAPYPPAGSPSHYEDSFLIPNEEYGAPNTIFGDSFVVHNNAITAPPLPPALPELLPLVHIAPPLEPYRSPQDEYGLPAQTLNDDFELPLEKIITPLSLSPYPAAFQATQDDCPEEPHDEYGPPAKEPHDEYGPPLVKVNTPPPPPPPALPELPPLIYAPPPPSGPYPAPHDEYGPPAEKPHDEYGPPLVKVNTPPPPPPPALPELPPLIHVLPPPSGPYPPPSGPYPPPVPHIEYGPPPTPTTTTTTTTLPPPVIKSGPYAPALAYSSYGH